MKFSLLTFSFVYSISAFCQTTTTKPTRNITDKKPQSISTTHSETLVPDSLKGETLAHIDYCINAIDSKVEYVNSDKTMREKAEKDGWFIQMGNSRKNWVARREALVIVLNQEKK